MAVSETLKYFRLPKDVYTVILVLQVRTKVLLKGIFGISLFGNNKGKDIHICDRFE